MPRVGTFSSSNPMLDKIYAGFRETNEGLTISGMLVDCPNRERLGYGGDAHSHIEFVMSTYNSLPFFTKWLRDWADTSGIQLKTLKSDPLKVCLLFFFLFLSSFLQTA